MHAKLKSVLQNYLLAPWHTVKGKALTNTIEGCEKGKETYTAKVFFIDKVTIVRNEYLEVSLNELIDVCKKYLRGLGTFVF